MRGDEYFNAFHGAIMSLYEINPLASEIITLAAGKAKFPSVLNAAEKAFKKVYEHGYTPDDLLTVKQYADLINDTKAAFDPAIEFVQSDVLKSYLDKDVFVFSGLKAHKELTQARSLLKDDKGAIKPYYKFEQDIVKLNNSYNKLYLEAEYEFAVHSAQSADQWSNLSDDTGRYLLQYRTAQDERVRENHQALAGTTLPKDDPFWDSYYPPNGWRCRCVAIEVLAGKYPVSNSAEAIAKGETATTQIGKSGGNKLAMFRFNPGKQAVIFPPNHPYKKVPEEVKKAVEKIYETSKDAFVPAKTVEEAKEWAKNNLGILNDKRNLSVQALNSINEALFDLHKDFDFNKKLFELGNTANDRASARAAAGFIHFNKKWFEKTDPKVIKDYKRANDYGWWPKINDKKDPRKMIVDHEFAHCLTSIEFAVKGNTSKSLTSVAKRYNQEMNSITRAGGDYKKSPNFISLYAETNHHEFVSEAFTSARNSDNPSPYAKEVYEIIKKEYGRK